jgi:hypothetical protein
VGCGSVGSAEEERHHHSRHRDGVHELRHEEQGEADRRVLGVETPDKLLLGLGKVERRTLKLGGDCD